ARIETNVVPTLASTRLMRCNCIDPITECAEFGHPYRGLLLGGNVFAQADSVQRRQVRQFLADDVDKAAVDGHLRSVRLVVDVLDVTAEPALLFQVSAKLPQELPEIPFCKRIVCRQFLPYNLTVLYQVRREHMRRVIST